MPEPTRSLPVSLALVLMGSSAFPCNDSLAQSLGPFLDEVIGVAHADLVGTADLDAARARSCTHTRSLTNGVQLAENLDLYKVWHPQHAYGRPELVDLLVETGEFLAFHAPHTDPFMVGDLSAPRGGPLPGHLSHQGGIDADVGLYWGVGQQHLQGFVDIRPQDLDVEATWLEILGMLRTGLVERIFLDQGHINRLRAYTLASGELSPEEAAQIFPARADPRIWQMTGVVQHLPDHRNHLHVRVLCAPD